MKRKHCVAIYQYKNRNNMKRPDNASQDFTGIQEDTILITNMRKQIQDIIPQSEDKKHPFIMVNGKQFPKRWYNPQMAKRKMPVPKSLAKTIKDDDVNSNVDQYIVNYEFPAFPYNSSLKLKSTSIVRQPRFNKIYSEQLLTQKELQKISKMYRKDDSRRNTLMSNNQIGNIHFATTDNIYQNLSHRHLRATFPLRNRPVSSFS